MGLIFFQSLNVATCYGDENKYYLIMNLERLGFCYVSFYWYIIQGVAVNKGIKRPISYLWNNQIFSDTKLSLMIPFICNLKK